MVEKEKKAINAPRKLNAASMEALAAIESRDADRLAAAIGEVSKKGVARLFSSSGKMASHMLSTAIAQGWLEGARLLMPLDNQWSPVAINWATRRPLALGDKQEWGVVDLAFGKDIECGPLGVACISGQVECAKMLLARTKDDKRRRVANFPDFSGNLKFIIATGAKEELRVYLTAMGPLGQAQDIDQKNMVEACGALVMLADRRHDQGHGVGEAAAAGMLQMLLAHGFKDFIQKKTGKSREDWSWADGLWTRAIINSWAGMVAALIDEGMPPQSPAYGKSPLRRAAESGGRNTLFAMDVASQLLKAGVLGPSIENRKAVALDALEGAVKESNWKIAELLVEACPPDWASEQGIRASVADAGKLAALDALFKKSATARIAEEAQDGQDNFLGESLKRAEMRAEAAEKRLAESDRMLAGMEALVRRLEALVPQLESADGEAMGEACEAMGADFGAARKPSIVARERVAKAMASAPTTSSGGGPKF